MKRQALRGVNLGGWLVLEPWITPSLFEGTDAPDEFTFCDEADAKRFRRLSTHRKTFVTEKDFEWLAGKGIQAVRVPVGYWIFGGQPPYSGSISYLDRAFDWAERYGLRVLVCLHGAPGSQNGTMHSGRQGSTGWPLDQKNINGSLDVIAKLADRYAGRPSLLGLELLNEPSNEISRRKLTYYYVQAYRIIRRLAGQEVWVVFSDRFKPWRWAWILHWPLYQQAFLDSHQYQIFTPADQRLTLEGHNAKVRAIGRRLWWLRRHRRFIIGEWSAALQVESLAGFNNTEKQEMYRRYAVAQRQAYDQADAWFYWTYKTEDDGPWNFRAMHTDII